MICQAPLGVAAVALALALLGGCSDSRTDDEPRTADTPTQAESVTGCPEPTDRGPQEYDAELRQELLDMLERDQSGRTGGVDEEGDEVRTERLKQIIAEHGWPGFDLVGEDGEDAAWAIAQHSDLDLELQKCALTHLEIAVDAGQGSPGNLAYLSDRVAVAEGKQQTYGTQVRCAPNGKPKPATPLAEPERIEELRAAADLETYEQYLAEMVQICGEPMS